MMSLARINCWLKLRLCGHRPPSPSNGKAAIAPEVRGKSHELANLAAISDGIAHAAKKESEAIDRFARAIRR